VVPIEFLDLLAPLDAGWEPLSPDTGPRATWSDGGSLADAPVDVAATFDGAAWRSTSIDPSFGLTGVRLRGGFTVPAHRHNRSLLLLVFGGAVTVRFAEPDTDEQEAQVGSGQFCVIEAETVYSLTAVGDGATFLSSWPNEAPELETTWYPGHAWTKRSATEER
jgi:quercetin dioxygenase-like cupin family protein